MLRKYIRRCVALLLVGVMLFSFGGCSAARRARPSARANKTVATAGGMEIPYENLYYITMTRIAELKRVYGEDVLSDPAKQEELEAFVWETLVSRAEALMAIGQDYGLSVEEGEIAANVQEDMENILANAFDNDRDAYIDSLNTEYLTDHYVRTYLAVEEHLPAALISAMLRDGTIDDADETAWAFLNGEDFIRVRQVLIETRNYGGAEAAYAKAQALHQKVTAAATDEARYDAMMDAMAFSTDLDMTGQGTYFAKGEMTAAYEAAAFALPLYGVSDVMTVDNGYCFIMRLPKDAAYMEQEFQTMKEKSYYVALNNLVDARLSAMTVEATDYGNSLDLMNLPPIDADGGEVVFVVSVVLAAVLTAGLVIGVVWYIFKRRGKGAKSVKT